MDGDGLEPRRLPLEGVDERVVHAADEVAPTWPGRPAVRPGAQVGSACGANSGAQVRLEPLERSERRFGNAAVIIGRTRMSGRFDATPFTTVSRYTHVFVRDAERWRLASAQGTPT